MLLYLAPISILAGIIIISGTARATPEPVTIQGVPQQIVPQQAEIGLGNISIQTGTGVFGGGSSGSSGSGSSGSSGGEQTDSSSLDLMMSQSWGEAASQNAQALGINATALAATCQLENQCQNTSATSSGSTVTGAFQMTNSTFQAMYQAALKDDPNLASTTTDSATDPASEAAAAAEYLKQGAQALQKTGDANPTVLDVRGYYNFGPQGADLATADQNATVASVLTNTSAATLAKNGVTPGETVAQWQASVSSKIGSAATAPVLG